MQIRFSVLIPLERIPVPWPFDLDVKDFYINTVSNDLRKQKHFYSRIFWIVKKRPQLSEL